MKTDKFHSVKNEDSIKKCLESSENPNELGKLLESLDVQIKFTGIKKHFQDDKEERLTGIFKIIRNKREIEFNFGFSIHDTEIFSSSNRYHNKNYNGIGGASFQKSKDKKVFMNDLLYSCFACLSSEYYCPIDFDEFCADFGYDSDSIKAKSTWELCLKQSSKLQKVFNEEEVQFLPS